MQNLAAYAKAHADVPLEILETEFFSPKAIATNLAGTGIVGGAGTAAAAVDPTGISPAVIGLSTLLSSQVLNPNSILSKWLTTGLVPKQVAIRAAAEFGANVATRGKLGDLASDAGVTEAVREGSARPIRDKVGGFIDRQIERFR